MALPFFFRQTSLLVAVPRSRKTFMLVQSVSTLAGRFPTPSRSGTLWNRWTTVPRCFAVPPCVSVVTFRHPTVTPSITLNAVPFLGTADVQVRQLFVRLQIVSLIVAVLAARSITAPSVPTPVAILEAAQAPIRQSVIAERLVLLRAVVLIRRTFPCPIKVLSCVGTARILSTASPSLAFPFRMTPAKVLPKPYVVEHITPFPLGRKLERRSVMAPSTGPQRGIAVLDGVASHTMSTVHTSRFEQPRIAHIIPAMQTGVM